MGRVSFVFRVWGLVRGVAVAVLAAMLPWAAAADEATPTARVRTNVVIRAEPMGAPAPALGALRPGEHLEIIGDAPYFHQVRLPDGQVGYVSKRWTQVTGDDKDLEAAARPLVIRFVDVGQGDATLVECPNGSTLLIDAGSTSGKSPDEVRQAIVPRLEALGSGLDYLIVSHPDADHYNLLAEVLDEVAVGRAWYVGERSFYNDASVFDWLRNEPDQAEQLKATYYDKQAVPNPNIDCGAAKVWILAAAVDHPESRKNAMSIVVMIRLGDFEAVITGDATFATEKVILSRYAPAWLDVDVLRIGHHGSLATSTTKGWADVLSPRLAVASAGYDNSYGHPRSEVIDRLTPYTATAPPHGFRSWHGNPRDDGPRYLVQNLEGYAKAVYATAMSGTITVTTNGSGYTVTTERD